MTVLPQLYLASQSPRRAALLQQIGVHFEVLPVAVDEIITLTETPEHYAQRLALEKARAGWYALPPERQRPVLGADTIVIAADTVMGKPADRQHAIEMLLALSGTTHRVITAVAMAADHEAVCSQQSRVTFRTITRQECAAYWDSGEPRDKAGAYGYQDSPDIVSELNGSRTNVFGLPMSRLKRELERFLEQGN